MGTTGARSQKESRTPGYFEASSRATTAAPSPVSLVDERLSFLEGLCKLPVKDSQRTGQDSLVQREPSRHRRGQKQTEVSWAQAWPLEGQQAGGGVSFASRSEGAQVHGRPSAPRDRLLGLALYVGSCLEPQVPDTGLR